MLSCSYSFTNCSCFKGPGILVFCDLIFKKPLTFLPLTSQISRGPQNHQNPGQCKDLVHEIPPREVFQGGR